jgi:electron transfer flavoprotein beta subunit
VSKPPINIGVALRRQSLRPELDPLSGALHLDERFMGSSEADLAALEWALRLADAWGGEVVAVCAGPPESEAILRMALAAGASRAVYTDVHPGVTSLAVASALAPILDGSDVVLCGDCSLDYGSGGVPALLAAELSASQALGLVRLEPEGRGVLQVDRRLDGGRRERLRVRAPAVLSVEGSTARLRRASLAGTLQAQSKQIERVDAPTVTTGDGHPHVLRPYRPRARALDAPDPSLPARERIRQLSGALSPRGARQVVRAEPAEAAEELLSALRNWGYLD